MSDPRGMGVRRTGQAIAPESLAPLPADWATASPPYTPIVVPHPDDPAIPIFAYIQLSAGGDPVTGVGWNFDFDNNWDGNP